MGTQKKPSDRSGLGSSTCLCVNSIASIPRVLIGSLRLPCLQRTQDIEDEELLFTFRRGLRSVPISGQLLARYMRFLVRISSLSSFRDLSMPSGTRPRVRRSHRGGQQWVQCWSR